MGVSPRRFRIEGAAPVPDPPVATAGDEQAQSAPAAADPLPWSSALEDLLGRLAALEHHARSEEVDARFRSLVDELEETRRTLAATQREVAAIRVGSPTLPLRVQAVPQELHQVLDLTAGAAASILAAAERIEMLAGVVQSETTLERARAVAGDIAHVAGELYETCAFQDLAGQRIARLGQTFDELDRRLERMVELWGGPAAIAAIVREVTRQAESERDTEGTFALAQGPRLAGESDYASQGDIDALFA